jgi:signal transduction histidine kinase
MSHWRSLKSKTALLAFFLLAVFLIIGILSIDMLRNVENASTQIREHWLESTRIIGDLNNYTSDFRADESGSLLAINPAAINQHIQITNQLNEYINQSRKEYLQLQHDQNILALFEQFENHWIEYKKIAQAVMKLAHSGNKKQATEIYLSSSQSAYTKVSESLSELTNETVRKASDASEYAEKTYDHSQSLLAFALILGFLTVCMILIYIRKYIALPLLGLADNVILLGQNKLDVDIKQTHRTDEIGAMAKATKIFKAHAKILHDQHQDLLKQTTLLEEKLGLEQQMTELQRNFISMVSHEFRTPLSVIDAQAQRLIKLSGNIEPEDIENRSEKIRLSVSRLTNVLGNILDTTKIYDKHARLPFSPKTIHIDQVIREACRLNDDNEKHIEIKLTFEGKLPIILADPNLLFVAISNILNNAVKYSPNNATVTVDAFSNSEKVYIDISDHGIGIPKKELESIFERYQRGSNTSAIEGSGIGLHLAKSIIDLHGGAISVDSQQNKGSKFMIQIPLRQ